jgi:hypothetical protein
LIAMRAIHLLAGCVLGLGFAATANAATNVDAGSVGAADCTHAGASTDNARDSAASGGDIMSLSHTAGSGSHADAPVSGKGGGDSVIHGGGGGSDDAAPAHTRAASLGWQSLLPGSIQ